MNPRRPDGEVIRFPGWELRVDEHQLVVDGREVKLGRPPFNLLLALVRGEGRVVGKAELMAAGWPGRVVEDNNLTVQLSTLRKLLGTGTIANVSGLGYRLVAQRQARPAGTSLGLAQREPGLPRLYGRDADLAAVTGLLRHHSVVSIVGTGGVGKTSLARTVLALDDLHWPDGAHWIDMAPLAGGTPMLAVVGEALGVMPDASGEMSEELLQLLARLQALIVLDNCEHLVDELAAFVGMLQQRAHGIRWLVTSQEPLKLDNESVYRLAPLDLPPPGADRATAMACGALALFQARVGDVDGGFEFSGEAIDLAVDICRHLDGLPLAIEMAAARVATLGLAAVREQIGQLLHLQSGKRSSPRRQHTLLQTYEWSYALLSPVEQRVFRRLEPFVGGFTAQMAQRLCCGIEEPGQPPLPSWEVLDALSALVEKSLLQRPKPARHPGPGRLQMLESARKFALMKLDAAGELAAVQRCHASSVADAFELAHYELERWRDIDWAEKYGPERRNVGAALEWACGMREPALLARLAAALAQLDTFSLADPEVVRHPVPLEVLLQAPQRLRALACMEFGWAHYLADNREIGTDMLERALADYEALGDLAGIYGALTRLIRMVRGRPGMQARAAAMWARLKQIDEREVPLRSRLRCQISVASHFEGGGNVERLRRLHHVARSAGFDGQAASCQLHISNELLLSGRYEEAAATAQAILQEGVLGVGLRTLTWHNLALALVRLERYAEARTAASALLRAMPSAAHLVMDLFAWVACRTGQLDDAALMAGRSAQIKQTLDYLPEPAEATLIEETHGRLAAHFSDDNLSELMQLGASMSTADTLALARLD